MVLRRVVYLIVRCAVDGVHSSRLELGRLRVDVRLKFSIRDAKFSCHDNDMTMTGNARLQNQNVILEKEATTITLFAITAEDSW